MNKVIYIRTSTELQDPEQQLKDIYTIAPADAEVISEKQSAWKDHIKERAKFKELTARINTKKVQAIYIWDLDRLYRNRAKTIGFLSMCQTMGCTVYSYRQQWLNEFDRMDFPKGMDWLKEMLKQNTLNMFAWINEEESNRRSARIRKAVVHTSKGTKSYQGKKWGRPTVIVDEEAILKQREEGISIRKLAKLFGVSRGKIHSVLKSKADSYINKTPDSEGVTKELIE